MPSFGSQRQWVANQLLAGKPINHADLIKQCHGFGGWRLGSHIHKLRANGWQIESIPMLDSDQPPTIQAPVEYRLKPGWLPDNRKPQLQLFM